MLPKALSRGLGPAGAHGAQPCELNMALAVSRAPHSPTGPTTSGPCSPATVPLVSHHSGESPSFALYGHRCPSSPVPREAARWLSHIEPIRQPDARVAVRSSQAACGLRTLDPQDLLCHRLAVGTGQPQRRIPELRDKGGPAPECSFLSVPVPLPARPRGTLLSILPRPAPHTLARRASG